MLHKFKSILNPLYKPFKDSNTGKIVTQMKDFFWFSVLLFSFHYLYLWWSESTNFAPIKSTVDQLFVSSSDVLFKHSQWTLNLMPSIKYITEGKTFWVYNDGKISGYVEVAPGCTSLKQWLHWLFLMLIFPGPWKHKVWYIPIGLLFIHFINVLRIVGLTISVKYYPQHFEAFHNYLFKTLFYFLIFMMWVFWVEKFKNPRKKPQQSPSV